MRQVQGEFGRRGVTPLALKVADWRNNWMTERPRLNELSLTSVQVGRRLGAARAWHN